MIDKQSMIHDIGPNAVHLCVDAQTMFLEGTEWKVKWFPRTLPNICNITKAHPTETIFTRFIPVEKPGDGHGMWRPYYQRWAHMTRQNLDPHFINIIPELAALAPSAEIIDKEVYGPWLCTHLHERLTEKGADTLIITGLETEVCVLATISGAVDLGYRVIVVDDAVCSSTDFSHDSILNVYRQRYSMQIDIVKTSEILTFWQ